MKLLIRKEHWIDLLSPAIAKIFKSKGCVLCIRDSAAKDERVLTCTWRERWTHVDVSKLKQHWQDDFYTVITDYLEALANETNLLGRTYDWPLWGAALRREILNRRYDVRIDNIRVSRGAARYTEDFNAP